MNNFADSRMEVPRYRSSPQHFIRSFFSLSVCSSSEVLGKNAAIRSELPTALSLLVSGRKERKVGSQPALLCRKRLRYHRKIIHNILTEILRIIELSPEGLFDNQCMILKS